MNHFSSTSVLKTIFPSILCLSSYNGSGILTCTQHLHLLCPYFLSVLRKLSVVL